MFQFRARSIFSPLNQILLGPDRPALTEETICRAMMDGEFPPQQSIVVRSECLRIISGMFLQITPHNRSHHCQPSIVINALLAVSRASRDPVSGGPTNDPPSTLVLDPSIRLCGWDRMSRVTCYI